MIGGSYRPAGKLRWMLDKCGVRRWSMIGCLAAEERCHATWSTLSDTSFSDKAIIFEIVDVESRFSQQSKDKRNANKNYFLDGGIEETSIREYHLLCLPQEWMTQLDEFFSDNTIENLVLDISAFPKRFFFPIIKYVLRKTGVQNLMISYAIAKSYTNEHLAENHGMWETLPTFGGQLNSQSKPDMLVIGAGYITYGLPEHIWDHGPTRQLPIKVLFPFPSNGLSVKRNWGFLENLFKEFGTPDITPVDGHSIFSVFEKLVDLSMPDRQLLLAPYGPKPMSAAMALFATANGCPVYYTQPSAYHPDYTKDIATDSDGNHLVFSYLVRINGNDLFTI